MKKLLLLLVLSFTFGLSTLWAQQVVSSGGAYFKGTNASLSWTIGEPICETVSNGMIVLTQGFQQGHLISSAVGDLLLPGIISNVYPNPTDDGLNLIFKDGDFFKLEFFLYNLEGKALLQQSVKSDLTKIDMRFYPVGVYLIRVVMKSGEPIRSFRVIKR